MPTLSGKCVFCGGRGLTKGHVWPEWLQDILPRKSHHLQFSGRIASFAPSGPISQKLREGHAGTRKPRNTCLSCNTGWMSRIEQAAMPDATPLILGKPVTLDADGQRRLATLISLVTMRAEFLDTKTAANNFAERTWIKEKSEPPANWKIWIARYAGTNNQHWVYHHGLGASSSPDVQVGACDTQATTMVIGELCAHAFSSRSISDFDGYTGIHMFQIWPVGQTIEWWATLGIGDRGVVSLSEAFAREFMR